jgi:hypothetical protein
MQKVDRNDPAFIAFLGNLNYDLLLPDRKLSLIGKFLAHQEQAAIDASRAEKLEAEITAKHGAIDAPTVSALEKSRLDDAKGARTPAPALVHKEPDDSARAYIAKLPPGERRLAALWAWRESDSLREIIARGEPMTQGKAERALDALRARYGSLIA